MTIEEKFESFKIGQRFRIDPWSRDAVWIKIAPLNGCNILADYGNAIHFYNFPYQFHPINYKDLIPIE